MSWLLLATRLVLGFIFLAAGLAKLLDVKGSRKAITDFGLPEWSAKSLGIGLPLGEIAIARNPLMHLQKHLIRCLAVRSGFGGHKLSRSLNTIALKLPLFRL